MTIEENRYWTCIREPSEEVSEVDRQQFDFLNTALREGYRPYMFHSECFGATSGQRGGMIVRRGWNRKRWEVRLGTVAEEMASVHVDDYACAAQAVLQWLRGCPLSEAMSPMDGHRIQQSC